MKLVRALSILAVAGLVFVSDPASFAWVTAAQAGKAYSMVCKGGGKMTAQYFIKKKGKYKHALYINFKKAPKAANVQLPGPGECAWLDRPLRRNEPTKMLYDSNKHYVKQLEFSKGKMIVGAYSGTRMKYLINAVYKGKPFSVKCFWLGGDSYFYVDRVGK